MMKILEAQNYMQSPLYIVLFEISDSDPVLPLTFMRNHYKSQQISFSLPWL